ncbi:alpha/beta fold hydrolase [Streptomyces sp. NPDC005402]|uniref:alpha/beta fold hydrolase n=1 Tax=Streptomyces sp. NPDC005402 TaxID=3155338 RepID=UPI0033B9C74B
MDTASVVRDMDAIRSGLGEQRISYYGVSYGTLIGQQYAELYPSRIRRGFGRPDRGAVRAGAGIAWGPASQR